MHCHNKRKHYISEDDAFYLKVTETDRTEMMSVREQRSNYLQDLEESNKDICTQSIQTHKT